MGKRGVDRSKEAYFPPFFPYFLNTFIFWGIWGALAGRGLRNLGCLLMDGWETHLTKMRAPPAPDRLLHVGDPIESWKGLRVKTDLTQEEDRRKTSK
eukprot:5544154-Amphidinium_carterae.2